MRAWSIAAILLGGCGFQTGAATATDGGGTDASVGSDATSVDAQACFGAALFAVCLGSGPTGALLLDTPMRIDTDSDPRCAYKPQAAGRDVCGIAAGTIEVGADITTVGAHPLVLVAAQTLTVSASGTLDVSSTQGGFSGAGASSGTCVAATTPVDNTGGAGGGAGGSFGDLGGGGALGNYAVGRPADQEAPGGVANPVPVVVAVQGGCAGETGGSAVEPGGAGGFGGGALYLIAGTQIVIDGTLAAGGAGGTGGGNQGGGGGGGTGGLIGLDAPAIAISGTLAANGGGGAQGGSSQGTGVPGHDALPSATARAPGGTSSSIGGAGGDGGFGGSPTGDAGSATDSGGGAGGGSVGVIQLHGTVTGSGQFSPAPR